MLSKTQFVASFLVVPLLAINIGSAQTTKSIVIGVDGLGFGTHGLDVATTPAIDSLITGLWQSNYRGAYSEFGFSGGSLGTPTQQPTVSGPGWSTMLTGVWADRHGVSGNGSTFTNGDFDNNPPYPGIVKSIRPNLVTASFVNWNPIDTNLFNHVDNDGDSTNDMDFRGTYATDQATGLAS